MIIVPKIHNFRGMGSSEKSKKKYCGNGMDIIS
jgi:hypothetical protein